MPLLSRESSMLVGGSLCPKSVGNGAESLTGPIATLGRENLQREATAPLVKVVIFRVFTIA